ncbi:group III truncated hemoglobin [Roseivirga sp. E12]|uniref:group III truncated hemoglobin n=1 Tax=Roseivirga sp. E12 TaxID=2819237 RepID=UPI001ABBF8E7|nr:group III truncated hemoglobin [Roseivirga sp. E12]MBO3698251.1 group III truncated hemoglobin [Roseivirga sp. E12]
MKRKEIESREDVALLVNTFYAKVRAHETLGPIFNGVIEDWPEHLDKLVDFWETNLFFVRAYKGNPLKAHLDVDRQFDHSIEQAHFGNWLQLWFETLDELFIGDNVDIAKTRARTMAHTIFLRIFSARPH